MPNSTKSGPPSPHQRNAIKWRFAGEPMMAQHLMLAGFLAILVQIPLKITKLPNQLSTLGHHRSARKTPFKWRFAGGPMVVLL